MIRFRSSHRRRKKSGKRLYQWINFRKRRHKTKSAVLAEEKIQKKEILQYK
jgi:hypothetical protein